jgi:hypothetical protein
MKKFLLILLSLTILSGIPACRNRRNRTQETKKQCIPKENVDKNINTTNDYDDLFA